MNTKTRLIAVLAFCSLVELGCYSPDSPSELVVEKPVVTWRGKSFKEGGSIDDGISAIFEGRNVGRSSIRILSTESGCGCAQPIVEPTVVKPGQTCRISVQATPFPLGEKSVPITLRTDSKKTPTILLTLQMLGSQPPPFLLTIVGDLTFDGLDELNVESREVELISIENASSPPSAFPQLQSDLPFVKFSSIAEETKPYLIPEAVQRRFKYRVSLDASALPGGTFVGNVWVNDPWVSDRRLELKLLGRSRERLQATPSPLNLTGSQDGSGVLQVLTEGDRDDLRVEAASKNESHLLIERRHDNGPQRIATFQIRVRKGVVRSNGSELLRVYSTQEPDRSLEVPVFYSIGGPK
jgi:hypothetical protein